jgi:hypothetical protein
MIAGAAATLTAFASGLASGVMFGLAEALPAVFLVRQALRWRGAEDDGAWAPAGSLVMSLIGLGIAALGIAGIVLATGQGGFRGAVFDFLAAELAGMIAGAGLSPQDSATRATDIAGLVAPLFPAMAVGSWLFMTAVNGLLAQGALARFALNRRPSPDIAALTVPGWLAGLLAATLGTALAARGDVSFFAWNLLPVLGFGYVFAGLAVLHAALRRYGGRLFVLVPAYVSLLLGWPLLLLAACGMIDQWFGLRSRFAAAAPP